MITKHLLMKVDEFDKAVIDASYILHFLLPDERKNEEIEIFQQFQNKRLTLIASELLPFEVTNGIKSAIKQKRITRFEARQKIEEFLSLKISLIEIDYYLTLETALEEDISVYDASYLSLANEIGVPLLTLDNKLKKLAEE